jgi:hypothetical protein
MKKFVCVLSNAVKFNLTLFPDDKVVCENVVVDASYVDAPVIDKAVDIKFPVDEKAPVPV